MANIDTHTQNLSQCQPLDIRARREFLGLTIENLSERTGIHQAILADFEQDMPASTHLDQTIEEALLLPPGAVRGLAHISNAPVTAEKAVKEICASMVAKTSRRWAPAELRLLIVLHRYGLFGDAYYKYSAIAEKLKISRSMAFYVVQCTLSGIPAGGLESPPIRELAMALKTILPAKLDVATEHFRPLLGGVLSLKSLNRFATDFLGSPIFLVRENTIFDVEDESVLNAVTAGTVNLEPTDGSIKLTIVPRVRRADKSETPDLESRPDRYLIGTKIALRRQEIGLSIDELANRLGLRPSQVQRQEILWSLKEKADVAWENALEVEPGWIRGPLDRAALASARTAIFKQPEPPPEPISIRARREALGLSIDDLAIRTSVHQAVLADYERGLPDSTHLDRIIEIGLLLPPGAIRGLVSVPITTVTVLDEMNAFLSKLVNSTHKRRSNSSVEARVRMILDRYGAGGDDAQSYHAIGVKYGVSGSWAQQIITKAIASRQTIDMPLPSIRHLMSALSPLLPDRLDSLTEQFRPLLGGALSLKNVNHFTCDFLNEPLFQECFGRAFALSDQAGFEFEASRIEQIGDISGSIARAMVRRLGAANLRIVARITRRESNLPFQQDELAAILAHKYADFEWIDEDHGWFWFGQAHTSTVQSWIRKLLTVARRPLSFEEIIDGISHANSFSPERYELGVAELPVEILNNVVERFPWIEMVGVNEYRIVHDSEAPPYDVVNNSEALLIAELIARGGTASRQTLRRALVDSGQMGLPSFDRALRSSPLFRPLGEAQWKLIGSQ